MRRKISAFTLVLWAVCSLAFGMGDKDNIGIGGGNSDKVVTFGTGDKELIRLNGNVEVRHIEESQWSTVFSSQHVDDTDWIQTHEASLARLDFENGKDSATIFERTIVQIENVDPDKVSLRQWVGKIEVVVRHLFEKPIPVEVTTPSAVMAVRGSVAQCRVLQDGTTYVNASSGHIDVTAAGLTLSITGGQSVIVHPGAPPALIKALLHPTAAPKATSVKEDKTGSSASKNEQPSNNKSASQPQPSVSNQTNLTPSNSLTQQADFSKQGGPQGHDYGPPPGTIVMPNSDGTTTFSYITKPGQVDPKEIPPGVVKLMNPDGTATYTYTTSLKDHLGAGGHNAQTFGAPGGVGGPANGNIYFGTPPANMPMNTPGYPGPGAQFSGPPPGTIMTNNPNGTTTFTYIQQPGTAAPTNIPPGVAATHNPNGTTTYTYTGAPGNNMIPGSPGALPSFGPNGVVGAPGAGTIPTYTGPMPTSAPPPGTVVTNNANGTTTYTFVWRPGMPVLTNIPAGVVATPNGNGGVTYTYTGH